MTQTFLLSSVAVAATLATLPMAWRRLELSRAKHPSLTGHSRMARRVAAQLPGYAYDEARFFDSDGAPDEVQAHAARASFRKRLVDAGRDEEGGIERDRALVLELDDEVPVTHLEFHGNRVAAAAIGR